MPSDFDDFIDPLDDPADPTAETVPAAKPATPVKAPRMTQEQRDAERTRLRYEQEVRDAVAELNEGLQPLANEIEVVPQKEGMIFVDSRERPYMDDKNTEATFYPNGRIVFSPWVTWWFKRYGITSGQFGFPPDCVDDGTIPPTMWFYRGDTFSPVIRKKSNDFSVVLMDSMSTRLRRAWPVGEWTTRVKCSDPNSREMPNADYIVIPTDPRVHSRKKPGGLADPIPQNVRRRNRPEPGDVYANFKGNRRYILDVRWEPPFAPGYDVPTVTFSKKLDLSEPVTQKMISFKSWLAIGGRLLKPEDAAIPEAEDLLP